MRIPCQMYLPPKRRNAMGHITVADKGLVLAKKSKFMALAFGLIGTLAANAKDFDRIAWADVHDIEMKKYIFNKKACYITLKDESEYIFILKKPDKNIPFLQEQFRQSKDTDLLDNVFGD